MGTSPMKEDLGSRPAGVIMECGYGGKPGRRPVTEQAPAALLGARDPRFRWRAVSQAADWPPPVPVVVAYWARIHDRSSRHRMASRTCGTRSSDDSTSHAARQRASRKRIPCGTVSTRAGPADPRLMCFAGPGIDGIQCRNSATRHVRTHSVIAPRPERSTRSRRYGRRQCSLCCPSWRPQCRL